jgi:hypothetical protein
MHSLFNTLSSFAAVKTLSLSVVARMSNQEARRHLRTHPLSRQWRELCCPHCGCLKVDPLETGLPWKTRRMGRFLSITSRTVFLTADRTVAIEILVNGVKDHNALQISREVADHRKAAFIQRYGNWPAYF